MAKNGLADAKNHRNVLFTIFMGYENHTEFYFRPFSTLLETQLVIFLLFLLLYVLSLCGNAAVVLIVHVDHSLHNPMYFFLGFLLSLQLTILIFRLPFCGQNEINHFFCDIPVILQLACSDTHIHQAVLFIVSVVVLTIPFLLICISYIFIAVAILQIRSAEGQQKALSTCSSHLMVVLLQYGCCSFIYLRPNSSYSPQEGRVVSVVYTFVTPLLNPLIYSMRNKELKEALRRAFRRRVFSPKRV
ncbi:olfactory receptor 10V1-like [Podarcis raffonei]|uniref:olfactory receptor 10V1-like n=1 Tax=Podarcis raffonei TaxID=65483 RepID=UPI0023297F21|nr:olfactory receptor 10V1-like [Podarcis raffonei]